MKINPKNGRPILTREEFDAALRARGLKTEIIDGKECWVGVRLRTPEEVEAIKRAKEGDTEVEA